VQRFEIALPRPGDRLARGTLEQLPHEPPIGQRSGGGAEPVSRDLAPRQERQRERLDRDVGASRQVQRELDARADARAREASRRAGGHARRQGDERGSVGFVEHRQDAAPHLAALGAERERAGDLVERDGGGGGGDPVELIEEAALQRRLYAPDELRGIEPLELAAAVGRRGAGERRDRLPEDRVAIGWLERVELDESFEEEVGPSAHG
jgi:hypothetical protein